MKLIWRIVLSISLLMVLVLTIWTLLFYHAVTDEINDETDDALELFSERLIHRMLNGEGLPDADNGTNNTYFIRPVDSEYVSANRRTEYVNEMIYIEQKREDEPARVLRTVFCDNNGQYYLLTVVSPTVETEDLQESVAFWMLILYASCLFSVILIVTSVLWYGLKPLNRLLSWIKNNDISNEMKPLDNHTNINEYNLLNEAVLSSAQRSQMLYNEQKEFVDNASHEIQTPIAVCQNRLELLTNMELTERQFAEVMKVRNMLSYMSRLNKELLLLSKIDNHQFSDTETVDMVSLVRQSFEDCSQIFEQRDMNKRIYADTVLNIEINHVLASVIVNNLIKNAFVHNMVSGAVDVTVIGATLTVANSGTEPLDGTKIFRRFQHEHKRENSTGLGLAVAATAARYYGLTVDYRFENSIHIFSVNFDKLMR